MGNRVKLAVAYIRFYKKQAAVLFLGISMSVLLFTGIASLLHSNQYADYQNAREEFGDWAYRIKVSDDRDHGKELGNIGETSRNEKRQEDADRINQTGNQQEDVGGMNQTGKQQEDANKMNQTEKQQEYFASDGEGYQLTKEGYFASCAYPDEKRDILLCYGDGTYLEQTGRSLLEGRYPEQEGEIALDYYALHNLDVDSSLGSVLVLGKQSYILTGILSEGASAQNDSIMIFLAEGARQNLEMQSYCYLTFSDDSRAYEQFSAFLGENRIREAEWEMNDGLAPYIGAEPQESIVTVIRTAWHLQNGKLIYLLGTLENSRNLLSKTLLWILFLFSVFIIASILQVILEKRIRQYGIMEVLGMTGKDQWMSLWLELLLLFIPAYIVGSVAGNALAAAIYRGKFIVDQSVLFIGLIAFIFYLLLFALFAARNMQKYTQTEKMKSYSGRLRRNSISTRTHYLMGALSRRFLLEKKSNFIGIIFSLSLGGVLFLCTNYVAGNAKQNNIHSMLTDEKLYGDICASIDDDDLGKVIPQDVVTSLEESQLSGIEKIFPMSYSLGEISLDGGIFHWTDFYPEVATDSFSDYEQDPEIMEKYNGIATKQAEDSYRLKVNVYGYGKDQFQDLSDFILDGEIHPGKMLQENQVVLKTLMDGAGYYDGIDIQPGDHITLKVPKTEFIHTEADLLKFQSEENHYIQQDFEVAAVVSRCVGGNDAFIGSGTGVVSVIMPQQMMEEYFGISDYNRVNIKLDKTAQSEKMVQELRPFFQGLSSCVLHDYSGGIKRKNQVLMQKVYFFYGISVILFLISLLHAINSMKHLIWFRRYEFGVLRAMGITDAGFCSMLVRQGAFYGITSSIVMLVLTLLCQGVLAAIMQHVIRYIIVSTGISLVACIAMALWNTVVCILAMVCCGQELLREHVVDEIRG